MPAGVTDSVKANIVLPIWGTPQPDVRALLETCQNRIQKALPLRPLGRLLIFSLTLLGLNQRYFELRPLLGSTHAPSPPATGPRACKGSHQSNFEEFLLLRAINSFKRRCGIHRLNL